MKRPERKHKSLKILANIPKTTLLTIIKNKEKPKDALEQSKFDPHAVETFKSNIM